MPVQIFDANIKINKPIKLSQKCRYNGATRVYPETQASVTLRPSSRPSQYGVKSYGEKEKGMPWEKARPETQPKEWNINTHAH